MNTQPKTRCVYLSDCAVILHEQTETPGWYYRAHFAGALSPAEDAIGPFAFAGDALEHARLTYSDVVV